MSTYRIQGHVIDEQTKKGIGGLRVEVWDKDLIFDDLVGSTVTDAQGNFAIVFEDSYFQELFLDREPDLYFRIYRGDQLIKSTEDSVFWNVKETDKVVTIFVNVIDENENTSPIYPLPANENAFIPAENVNAIYNAINVVWSDSKQQLQHIAGVDNLLCQAAPLTLLWNDARDFLAGDTLAGNRLLSQLNTLMLSGRSFAQIPPDEQSTQIETISGDLSFLPNPQLSGTRYSCLFPPLRVLDIYFAIARLVALVPQTSEELVNTYFERVQPVVERLAPLENLHNAARRVLDAQPGANAYFATAIECISNMPGGGEAQFIAMSFTNLPELITLQQPFPIIDLCRLERWDETARAAICFRRLWAAPRYEIDDIVNTTRDISRRGCVGHEVEIRGRNLGRRGRITFGRGIEAAVSDWNDDTIRFTIPEGARMGDLGVCIDPEIAACVDFPLVCRLPATGTDHSFEVVRSPEIENFDLTGVRSIGTIRYDAEACTDVGLHAIVRHAERAIIRDAMGTVIWDSGDGEPRYIDTETLEPPLVLGDLRGDVTFTLEISNLCDTIRQSVELTIYHAVSLAATSRVRAGDAVEVSIQISCPAPHDGIEVTLLSSQPTSLPVPDDPIVINASETSTIVTLATMAPCAEVELRADAPGHREDIASVLIFGTPVITEVSPLEARACSSSSLNIQGDCFDPEASGNMVRVSDDTETISLSIIGIRFLDPMNRGRAAILDVQEENLRPGSWQIVVASHGLTSEAFSRPLVIQPVPAQIYSFTGSTMFITPCVANNLQLRWEVSKVERVEITSGGSTVFTRTYAPSCMRRTDSHSVTISEATNYMLLAYPLGGGSPTTESLRVNEISVAQAEEVTILNRTRGRHFPEHTLTIWQVNGTTGERTNHGVIRHAQSETVPLAHCNLHELFAVSHEWIAEHNRRFRADFRPDDPDIVLYSQFHKYTVFPILGRRGTGLIEHRVDPGG